MDVRIISDNLHAILFGFGLEASRTSAARPPIGRRWQEKKQLRPDHPTLVEGNIGGFPHHERIWGDSEHNILRNKISHGYPCHNFMMIRISMVYIFDKLYQYT